MFRRITMFHALLALVLVASGFGAACSPPSEAPSATPPAATPSSANPSSASAPAADGPNVLLIVIDTLRADHVGSYGSPRDTTPNLDRLAREGVRFKNAFAPAPWTKPSLASILTGLYPSSHGATGLKDKLPAATQTIAQRLSEHGYRTAGIVSGHFVGARWGFSKGFNVWDQSQIGGDDKISSPEIAKRARKFLEEHAQESESNGKPFFLFLHFFDPHYRYLRHPEFGFSSAGGGRLKGTETIHELRAMADSLTDEELNFIRACYDEEIRATDEEIGAVLKTLRSTGAYDDTAIIVTADHGEEFRERGWIGHTRTLFDELLRVPLLVKPAIDGDPPKGRRVMDRPVSTVAVAATIWELVGLSDRGPQPTADGERESRPAFQAPALVTPLGRRARKSAGNRTAENTLPVFAEVNFVAEQPGMTVKNAHKSAVVAHGMKLIRDHAAGTSVLYDLGADPEETVDLKAAYPEAAELLGGFWDGHVGTQSSNPAQSGGTAPLDPELTKALRELGYMEK